MAGKPYLDLCSEENQKIADELNVSTIHITLAHEEDYTTAYALALLK